MVLDTTILVRANESSQGLARHLLLEIITRSIEIECLPDEIPEGFTVNVSELMIGQAKRASDVELSGSMKLLSDPQTVIAHIVTLRAEEVAAPVEGAVAAPAAEPEVAKKGKKEEEEAAAEKGKEKEKEKEKGKKK